MQEETVVVLQKQGENSAPQNDCEAAKRVVITAEFLCSPSHLNEPDIRELFLYCSLLVCESAGLWQLQGCKPNEMYFYDCGCELNIKCSQECT